MTEQVLRTLEQEGWRLHHANEHLAAIEVFERMLALDERNVSALQGKIGSLRYLRRYGEACQLVQETLGWLGTRRESVGIRDELGWISYHQHQYQDALDHFEEALAIEPGDEGALQGKVAALRSLRQFGAAQTLLEQALAVHPSHAGLLSEQIWLLFDQRNYQEAIGALDRALEVRPDDTTLVQGKIAAYRLSRRLKEAQATAEQAQTRYPESPDILSECGWLRFDQNDYRGALLSFDRALAQDPRYAAALQGRIAALRLLRHYDEAQEAVGEAQKRLAERPEAVGILSEQGWLLFDQDRLQEAADVFQEALQLAPDWIQLAFSRVEVLVRMGRSHQAVRILEDLARAYPGDIRVQEQLGFVYVRRGDLRRAEAQFASICRDEPDNSAAWTGLGALHLRRGEYVEAVERFRGVLEHTVPTAIAHTNLAWALVRQGGKDGLQSGWQPPDREQESLLHEAEGHCRAALDLYASPAQTAEAYACLGVIAFQRGQIREAHEYLEESIRQDPREGHYVDLGALHTYSGRYEDAEASLGRALELDPNDVQAHIELGSLYLQLDRSRESAHEFRCAAALAPDEPDAWQGLGVTMLVQGDYAGAEEALREGLRRVDPPQRGSLYLVLAQVLAGRGEASQIRRFYEEALSAVNEGLSLLPKHADLYFQRGVIQYQRGEHRQALHDLRSCHKIDSRQFEAERYARWVEAQIRQQRRSLRLGWLGSIFLGLCTVGVLITLLVYYLATDKAFDAVAGALIPILLGFLVVAAALPTALVRLKLPGLEAEFAPPEPKEAQQLLSSGPQGEFRFAHSLSLGESSVRFW